MRTLHLSLPAVAALLALTAAFPGPSAAQTVEGVLTDREDAAPVEGVLVLLVDTEGREVDGRLSDEGGSFRLSAPEPGTYRIRTLRIGYASLHSDPFSLQKGDPRVMNLGMSKEAIPLEGIDVQGVQGCRIRPEEGLAVARVWEAVETALTVQSWTEREGLFRFEVLLFTRDLDPGIQKSKDEEFVKTEIVGRIPMQSLPADSLMARGFVREMDRRTYEFLAPDAQVLLSNAFLNTHCLKLTADQEAPHLIGLAFEPTVEGDLPDIEGTLWVDRESGELRFLEYGYTWVPFGAGREHAGGRLDFEALPGGAWIVRQWWIRMPTVWGMGRTGGLLTGYKETGAWITKITQAGH